MTIDTHQHVWKISERSYPWITPETGVLHADFGPEISEPLAKTAGITGTILVQAADSYADTFYMLSLAQAVERVRGVVAWVPLDRPDEARAALDHYAASGMVRGIRVLNHTYEDSRWLLREDVTNGINLLTERGLTLDVVVTNDEHRALVPELARRHPNLTIVIDHAAKPDIANNEWDGWAATIAAAAAHANVNSKISGLNTVSAPEWKPSDWSPYVNHLVQHFGANRLMLGSDWPVSLLNGDFAGVWAAQLEVISHLSEAQQLAIQSGTASRVYKLHR